MISIVSLLWYGCASQSPSDVRSGVAPADVEAPDVGQLQHHTPPSCAGRQRGDLVSVSFTAFYTEDSLEDYWDSWLNGLAALGYVEDTVDPGIENGATTFKVDYCTVDYDGSVILASGMLAIPSTWGWWGSPTVIYNHGTAVTRFDTPSNPNVDDVFDGPSPMVVFAGSGYIFIAPDLTGFGDSDAPQHRYFHTPTESDSTLDMLDAVEDYWLYWLKSNGELFNAGFSQGGNSALAFAEDAEIAGYDIEATGIVGGVGDPDAWFDALLFVEDSPYLQLYVAYLVVAYQSVYGDVYADPADAFAPPYDTTVEDLFDMDHLYFEVVDGLPGSSAELFTEDFYADLQDPDHPMRVHLRENAVDDVCLDSPVKWWHLVNDDEVEHALAVEATDNMAGCNDVELIDWVDTDHLNTWHQVLPEIRDYFDTL